MINLKQIHQTDYLNNNQLSYVIELVQRQLTQEKNLGELRNHEWEVNLKNIIDTLNNELNK
tara:strand:- start:300 stop:482 length:183 start_codon:yes stop_codon:yes gene_type:complete